MPQKAPQKAQHPLFLKYTRDFLHKETGFSKGYLSRLATGKYPLRRSFIERVCFKLGEAEKDMFLPDLEVEEDHE